jgi:hypothetical protein
VVTLFNAFHFIVILVNRSKKLQNVVNAFNDKTSVALGRKVSVVIDVITPRLQLSAQGVPNVV